MNIVAIDPSLASTAMVVNDCKFVYGSISTSRTKKLALKGWYEKTGDYIILREHDDTPSLDYMEGEVAKWKHFDEISHKIAGDIVRSIDHNESTVVAIEGYSFSSAAGPLIDLVTLGTLIRAKIIALNLKSNDGHPLEFHIVSPTSLKAMVAKLTYPGVPKNKKGDLEYRNKEGVAGGSFKKHDMYKALIENDNLQCEYVQFLREHAEEILALKSIPKPIEDTNDAKLLYEVIRAGLLTQ